MPKSRDINIKNNANGEVGLWDVGPTDQWPLAYILVINFQGDLFSRD